MTGGHAGSNTREAGLNRLRLGRALLLLAYRSTAQETARVTHPFPFAFR